MRSSKPPIHSVYRLSVQRENIYYISSCVFITPFIALTAAHSVEGADHIFINGVKASHWKVHEGYNSKESFYVNDIAIVEFNIPFAYSSFEKCRFSKAFRYGHGARNNKNDLAAFEVKLLEEYDSYFVFKDSSSKIGDSGGGIFFEESLVATHSTKEGDKIYCPKVSFYEEWITPYINKSPLNWLQLG